MPRGDHRGPDGEGPRTGRGMGFCRGAGRSGFATASQEEAPSQSGQSRQGSGRGCGGGRHGRRRRHLFHTTGLTGWQQQADRMTAELDEIRKQIRELQHRQDSIGEQAATEPGS